MNRKDEIEAVVNVIRAILINNNLTLTVGEYKGVSTIVFIDETNGKQYVTVKGGIKENE